MKKTIPLIAVLLSLLLTNGLTQSQPCGQASDEPPGCFLCGPVYMGSTAGYTQGQPGATFPCGSIENNQWLSVIAGSPTLTATIVASNCEGAPDGVGGTVYGVQLIIYDTNLTPVSTCFSSEGTNQPGNVTATNLTPGEIYWIMIDGFAGDICDFTITIGGGVAQGPPDPTGPITADPAVSPLCPNAEVCYSIAPVNNATDYEWTIPSNAVIISGGGINDTEVCVRYNSPGAGVLCVNPSNACFPGTPSCTPTVVVPIPIETIVEEICLGEFPIIRGGTRFSAPGNYNVTYPSYLGCDSVINYIFIPIVDSPHIIDTTICSGSCVTINNRDYCNAGSTTIVIPEGASTGCDSTINLLITFIQSSAVIEEPDSLDCTPGSTLTLDGSGSSSGNGVTYQWSAGNGGVLVPPTNQNTVVVSAPGTYILTVTQMVNGNMCQARDTVQVTQQVVTINTPLFTAAQTFICAGDAATFTISPVTGATSYSWTAPPGSTISGTGTSVMITFGDQDGDVCVTAIGPCGQSMPACQAVMVNPIPNSDFTVESPICQGQPSTITYTGNASAGATFTWSFGGGTPSNVSGPGPHEITWTTAGTKTVTLEVEENGCMSDVTSHSVEVVAPLQPPVISCTSNTTEITFSWNMVTGATDYTVTINGSNVGTQSGTSYTVTGLDPGDNVDITVTANTNSVCGPVSASTSCLAQNCPDVELNIDPVADICRAGTTGTIQLVSNPSGGLGGGMFAWSGPGVSSGGLFDPQQANAGANVISLTYTEGTCTYTEAITINVYDIPTADFTAESPICNTGTSTVTYTGSGSAGATYTWDFAGGSVVSGSGAGPYEVQWSSGGTYTVSLTVEENGCTSEPFSADVLVDEPLSAPVITCSETTTTVTFCWDAVAGATNYTVNLISGMAGTYDPNTLCYDVQGLSPGDAIEIEVIAEGATECGLVSTIQQCAASNCEADDVLITAVGPFCKDGLASTVQLEAVMASGMTGGTFRWSGPGTTPAGLFDPNLSSVNPGVITVRAVYTINNCTYENTMDIVIHPQPSAAFTVDNVICIDNNSTVSYTGNADPGADYAWDFGSGSVINGSGAGPYEINWGSSGNYNISLVVTENNCLSETENRAVQVDSRLPRPNINCVTTQNSIEFDWAPGVAGATSYTVNVLNGSAGVYDGITTYTVNGLLPEDQVEIEVVANGTSACGPSRDTLLCEAIECADVHIIMPTEPGYCLYDQTNGATIDLDAQLVVQGSGGDATKVWHDGSGGNGYITVGGTFFPYQAGPGTHTVCVDWTEPSGSTCMQTVCADYEVYAVPAGSFIVNDKICVTDIATALVTSAPSGSSFEWDFGGANVLSGSAGGPYELSWSQGGVEDSIRMRIERNGCYSDEYVLPVEIDNELVFPNVNCNSTNTTIEFTWDQLPGLTDYDVVVLNGGPSPTAQDDSSVNFASLVPEDEITIELTVSNSNSACPALVDTFSCTAKACPEVSLTIPPVDPICLNEAVPQDLVVHVEPDPQAGMGIWSGTAISQTGEFNPVNAGEGVHTVTFTWMQEGCIYEISADIEINEAPIAEAGVSGEELTCEVTEVQIGDAATTNGVTYVWELNGSLVGNEQFLIVEEPGLYELTVINSATGCRETDNVEVLENKTEPEVEPDVNNITCFGRNDGVITLTGSNGAPPYLFSFNNNGMFSTQNTFTNLDTGSYTIVVQDANGCESTRTVSITQPNEFTVELGVAIGENPVPLGESIELEAFLSGIASDLLTNVTWTPIDEFPPCDEVNITNCLTQTVTPSGQTLYTVRVETGPGCGAEDDIHVNVKKVRPVYIPSAISPNDQNNINDFLYIYADPNIVTNVKSFLVFDRWGEVVFEAGSFSPSLRPEADHLASVGWDGKFRGERLNSGVFVYYAELEFFDGVTEIYKGDVTIVK